MSVKKTNKQFTKEVYDLVGDEYTFLETYVNTRTKLEVVHNTCGHKYKVVPNTFLKGRRCSKCKNRGGTIRTDAKFVAKVKEEVGDEYTFLEPYVNTDTKLQVVHNTCGHKYEVTPHAFLQERRCPECNNSKWTKDIFLEKVRDEVGDEYTFLESYVNMRTKLPVIHNTCGHRYEVKPVYFLNKGIRCPSCNESKGERKIVDYLDKLGILYEREKTFSDLRLINNLRYDFAIYHKGELITLIEYDGEQHFVAVEVFGGEDYLLKTQLRDKIKNEYAKENNIPLLRIPYTEFDNIEEILDRYLTEQIAK